MSWESGSVPGENSPQWADEASRGEGSPNSQRDMGGPFSLWAFYFVAIKWEQKFTFRILQVGKEDQFLQLASLNIFTELSLAQPMNIINGH